MSRAPSSHHWQTAACKLRRRHRLGLREGDYHQGMYTVGAEAGTLPMVTAAGEGMMDLAEEVEAEGVLTTGETLAVSRPANGDEARHRQRGSRVMVAGEEVEKVDVGAGEDGGRISSRHRLLSKYSLKHTTAVFNSLPPSESLGRPRIDAISQRSIGRRCFCGEALQAI